MPVAYRDPISEPWDPPHARRANIAIDALGQGTCHASGRHPF
jgi:hypothetical protein